MESGFFAIDKTMKLEGNPGVGLILCVLVKRCTFVEWMQQCSTKMWFIMRTMAKGQREGSVIKMN